MSDSDRKPLTPKQGCEDCVHLRNQVDSARQSKSYLTNGIGTGYRSDKSRSRQYKQVQQEMERNDNAERLARAKLRMHELEAHEGITESNAFEYRDCMTIEIRGGRDRA